MARLLPSDIGGRDPAVIPAELHDILKQLLTDVATLESTVEDHEDRITDLEP